MIEDDELRALFQAESEEHLRLLEQGFLNLENTPGDAAALEEVLREAHSLKGAARMLGLNDIEMLSHRMEDTLRAATHGEVKLAAEWMERLYAGLDALKDLCSESISGKQANVDMAAVMALLDEEASVTPSESKHRPTSHQDDTPTSSAEIPQQAYRTESATQTTENASQPAAGEAAGETAAMGHTAEYHIDTIRVAPKKLDALMTHAGELMVTRSRIARRLHDAEEIVSQWEDLKTQFSMLNMLVANHAGGSNAGSPDDREALFAVSQGRLESLGRDLQKMYTELYDDSTRLENVASKLEEGIRVVRMLPMSSIFNLYPRMVRDIRKDLGKEVELVIEGGETLADKRVLEEMKDPVMHLIRNALHHGIEDPDQRERSGKPRSGTIRLSGRQTAANIVIEVEDDGRGLDLEKVRQAALKRRLHSEEELTAMTQQRLQSLIFASGLSTQELITDISGRGVGLDVVHSNVECLKGKIEVDSRSGLGCSMRCILPLTLATTRIILAQVAGRPYGIPVEFVQASVRIAHDALFTVKGRDTMAMDGEPISLARLPDLLELPAPETTAQDQLNCIILASGGEKLGVVVDDVLDEQEVVLKPAGALLKRVRNVSGSCILGSGEVCMVLNPQDIIHSMSRAQAPVSSVATVADMSQGRQFVVLLAEDSATTRIQEKRILEGAGYKVVAAVDGADAWEKLISQPVDALVTDAMMPNMTGFELTARIRQEKRFGDLPVILVTTLSSDEDKRKGLEAGANAYITKPAFDQEVLVESLKRLIGERAIPE